ncbi:TPA: PTS sugar transporter subunit IIC [Streptococcus suis]|nr:PTS sugar transporter subunit IIC [Streptococcus suis]HEL2411874.1 PTS sugar transporter subunit IIC [Streptococcus suis]
MNYSSFMSSLQTRLGKFATAMNRNMYVTAIRDAMLAYVPFTFVASIFLILAAFPVQGFNDFITNLINVEAAVWQGKLIVVYNASLAIGGLLVSITSAYSIAEKMKLNQLQIVLTSLVSFLILTPMVTLEDGATLLKLSSVSAESMFVAILVSIFTAVIYRFIDSKGIKIKMPASVPPAVSAPFESLIPSIFVILVFWICRLLVDLSGMTTVALINSTLGLPLTLLGSSIWGSVVIKLFENVLWFFGLHGGSIVQGVMTPVWQMLEEENRLASLAGEVAPNIISNSFFSHFMSIGLQGAVLAAILFAKSKQYKQVGRISVAPYVFNVGEPALFGFPIMLNFTLIIPAFLSSVVSGIIAYVAMATQLVPIPTGIVQLPWTTPVILSGFLVTNSWRGAVLQLIQLVVTTALFYPFIKVADNAIYAKEMEIE